MATLTNWTKVRCCAIGHNPLCIRITGTKAQCLNCGATADVVSE